MISPTCLLLSQNEKVLYAVSEAQPGIRGEIAAFHCTDKGLTLINKVLAPGAGLVHAALDPEEKLLFAVSYRDASILMYELREDGGIGELLDEKIHTGQGRDPVRQEKAHAHSVWFTPDGKRICVCDLGIDRLVVYEVNYSCMKLEEKKELGVTFPQGSDVYKRQMYIYQFSFEVPNYCISSAGAMILFVMVFVFTMLNVKLTGFLEDVYKRQVPGARTHGMSNPESLSYPVSRNRRPHTLFH